MRRLLVVLLFVTLAVWGMTGCCKPGLLPTEDAGKPKVTLERVEVAGAFPWADPPARNPLALAFVFNIENPSGYNIMLDNIKFAYSFEVNPEYYIEMNVPVAYDRSYFPPKTTSQYRVVNILDSAVITGKLMVTQGAKLQALDLKPIDLIKNWYAKIGDFAFGIKVGEGMAVFNTEKGDVFVPFEGKFPKK
ncbi:MAG TPA: hypothetical protein VLZ10_18140 [Thermodesulfobacteriota bacterium]|nr:hypothetical protein [Thermodesulfobacteriota bacterium]